MNPPDPVTVTAIVPVPPCPIDPLVGLMAMAMAGNGTGRRVAARAAVGGEDGEEQETAEGRSGPVGHGYLSRLATAPARSASDWLRDRLPNADGEDLGASIRIDGTGGHIIVNRQFSGRVPKPVRGVPAR